MNCERLKLSKTLYDMGMKVAAISTLCQDPRVFDAMLMAGTPCPYEGKIGPDAREAWKQAGKTSNVESPVEDKDDTKTYIWVGVIAFILFGI
ncbi:MAG: hypothetical protein MUQ75_00485 [Crocinitomicaceae bacterium]|nr:hypothetical protein [Crocinitomicaceae bacterium]